MATISTHRRRLPVRKLPRVVLAARQRGRNEDLDWIVPRHEPDLRPALRAPSSSFANRVAGQAVHMVLTRRPSLLPVLWVVTGVVVAATYDYFDQLETSGAILSAVVATLCWPLLVLGFDVRIGRGA
jgi:hypothetical protein